MGTIRAGDASITIDPESGRLTSLAVGDLELLVPRRGESNLMLFGSFPMVPYAGRIRDGRFRFNGVEHALPTDALPPHAIHGMGYDRPWVEHGPGRLHLDLDDRWPLGGRAEQTFELTETSLRQVLAVHATTGRFPASAGWHPWFARRLSRGGEAELDFRAGAMFRRDAASVPDGTLVRPVPPGPWDDCFTEVEWPVMIRWPGAIELSIDADTPCCVVYDQPEHAFCVEPQTAPPDILNLGPGTLGWFVVTPDEPLVAATTWSWG